MRLLRAGCWVMTFLALSACEARAEVAMHEVRECLRANAPRENSSQLLEVTSVDHAGGERRIIAKSYWKLFPGGRSKALFRVAHPPDVRGSAYLLIERESEADMFLYLPAVGRVRRINSRAASGSLFGTDFSYEDVRHLQGLAPELSLERQPDSVLDGRPVFVVEVGTEDAGSAYRSLVYRLDQQTCAVLRIDFLSRNGALSKQLTVAPESLRQVGHVWVPGEVRMSDLESGTRTVVKIEEVEIDNRMSKHLFSESALLRRR